MKDQVLNCAIVDDEPIALERLKDILDDFNEIKVTGSYAKYQSALEELPEIQPKLLFLDVELDKHHTAFELLDQLHSRLYCPYVILITAFDHYSIKAIKKEIFDYLVKPIDIDELKESLERLHWHISEPQHTFIEQNSILSEREKEVLELALEGETSKEIAEKLFVSKSTIDSHRKNILKKTGAKSFLELMLLSRT